MSAYAEPPIHEFGQMGVGEGYASPTPDEVLSYNCPTDHYCCPLVANRYGIEFEIFRVRCHETGQVLFEVAKDPDAPPIDVWRVAQATHQQMMDNPLGFADAVLACAGDRTPAGSLPVGAGFGRSYGAKAKIFQRRGGRQLPQDTDVITVWAEDVEASSTI